MKRLFILLLILLVLCSCGKKDNDVTPSDRDDGSGQETVENYTHYFLYQGAEDI